MNVLKTTLIQVLLLSGSLLAQDKNENPLDDDDPETFPERLRSYILRSAWQSEPIPVIPLPQGVTNEEGNHPQPGIPPPPPPDYDENSDDSQPPPPPPIPPPPTAEETTAQPYENVGGNYWYYPETPQTEPSTAAYNWWSYNTRQPYVETTTQPANNIWYNYYSTRKPTTFSWINWNSFTLSPTTMKYYWQAPAAGSPGSPEEKVDAVSTEESLISYTYKPETTVLQQNMSYNTHSKVTRPSHESWQFWDNISKPTSKYSWYSSGDAPLSSTEITWKHINGTHKLNPWKSKITPSAPDVSTLGTDSETLYTASTDRSSVPDDFIQEETIRPQSTWLESKPIITNSQFNTSHFRNVTSGSEPDIKYNWYATNEVSSERTTKLQEIRPNVVKNDTSESGVSVTSLDKVKYSVFPHGTETLTSSQIRQQDSRNETIVSERLPLKYVENIGVSPTTVKYEKEASIHNTIASETQNVVTPVLNVPQQNMQINSNVNLKSWTFWKNPVKPQSNFRYYWYSPEDKWLQGQLKSSQMTLEQLSKQTSDVKNTVFPQKTIYYAKSEAAVGLQANNGRESKFPGWKHWETSSKQSIADKGENGIPDCSSENIQVPSAIAAKSNELQTKTSISDKSKLEVTILSQNIELDSKTNRTPNSSVSWYFWNSTSNLKPKSSYKLYSAGNERSSAIKYDETSDRIDINKSDYGELSTLLPEERDSISTTREAEIQSQHGSASQYLRNKTSNPHTKFRYDWYAKGNESTEVLVKQDNKSTEHISRGTIASTESDTILSYSEGDSQIHHEDSNYDSTQDPMKSPIVRRKYWYTSGKSPERYKYIWESSNSRTLDLSTERSKTSVELEKGHFSSIIPKSATVNGVSVKEETSKFNNFRFNSELFSTRSPYPSERSKSQSAIRYSWYSPDDESRNVNVKSFANSDGSIQYSPNFHTQGKTTKLFKKVTEGNQLLQQKYGSYDSIVESTSYSPVTSEYLYTKSSETYETPQASAASSADLKKSSIFEDVHSASAIANSDVTVRPQSTWLYSNSNSSHISFTTRNNTSKPQTKYYWYGVDEVTHKMPPEARNRSSENNHGYVFHKLFRNVATAGENQPN